jgi:23S rRNA pseudouridine2605 synthase
MTAERLQKLLAAAGVASRRHSEALITAGRVRVDGRVVTELGTRADPARQRIDLDGRPLRLPSRQHYLILNKPPGYVTTAWDPQGRPTVFDLLPTGPRVFSVGRLDRESEGLLLLTSDGDLAYRIAHPRFGLEKEYHVWTAVPREGQVRRLIDGIVLEDGPAAAAVRQVSSGADGAVLAIVLHEGRNRLVRRMLAAVGLPVYRLLRVRLGPLLLGEVPLGAWRTLTNGEVAWVRRALAVTASGRGGRTRAGSIDDRD